MPLPDPLLRGTTRMYPIEMLFAESAPQPAGCGERRLLSLVLPPWQRPEVWTPLQKRRFVEGIFLGFGLGCYVTNGMEWLENGAPAPMAGWLIDGQQRISALRDFVQGDMVIFDDVSYQSLSNPERIRFMKKNFDRFELSYVSDEERLKELYDRLNFGGTAHEDHERASLAPLAERPRLL